MYNNPLKNGNFVFCEVKKIVIFGFIIYVNMFQLWFCTLLTFPRAYVKDTDFGARKLSYDQK